MGFEPMELLPVHALSKRAYSATLAPLHNLPAKVISIGESGIRTHDLKKSDTGFRDQLLKPLGHLSNTSSY